MDPITTEPEQETPGRRVSTVAKIDRELREKRRDAISTMLLSRTSYRKMVDLLREQLGIETSVSTIASDVAVIRQRWHARMTENYSSHVSEQMAYYDGLLRAVVPKALQGDHAAVQDLLAVLDRRARLVGMEQPDRLLVGLGTIPGAGGSAAADVAAAWAGAPREEQIARTEQIISIVVQATGSPLRLPDGPPLQNGETGNVIDLPLPEED